MIYGYTRVSTTGQARNGNSLDVQEKELIEKGATKIFVDAYTGKVRHRPELDKLMDAIQDGDTLIVAKLDRIARSTRDGIDIISSLLERGVTVNICNMGILDNTPTGKLIWTIFLAFAEFERGMIIARTSEGKAEKKSKMGDAYIEGRPVKGVPDFHKFYEKTKKNAISVTGACKELNISRPTWYKLAKEL